MLRYGIPAYRLPKDALDAEIEAVTLGDLQRVATTYFTPDNSYLALSRPAFTFRDAAIAVGGALLALAPVVYTRLRRKQPAPNA